MCKKYFLFVLLISLFACKKQVDKERPEFIGTWFGHTTDNYYKLEIDENSNVKYTEYSLLGGGTSTHHGVARANNNALKIGRFRGFKINEYPHEIDTANSNNLVPYPDMFSMTSKKANWKMVLSLINFYKADY